MATPSGGTPTTGRSAASERDRFNARNRKRRQRERERAEHGGKARRNEDIMAIIGKGRDDVIREVLAEELRPVVREAIDQDAVRAIRGLVGLAPAAILVLAEALESDDEVIRTRAATLIAKYTLGNPLVTPPRDDAGNGLVIINALPRPGALAVEGTPAPLGLSESVDATAELMDDDSERRRCDTCRLDKPLNQFPGDGPRCQSCMDEKKNAVIDAFLTPDERTALPSNHALPESGPTAPIQRQSAPGQPQVHQTGPGLQPGDIRTTWTEQVRQADPSGHQGGSAQARPTPLWGASGAFGGPPDPNRFSNGR